MSRRERILYWCIAIAIFSYLGVRASLIPLIHDEVVTYYLYMQSANFIPPWAYWDANNHFLNSAIGALSTGLFSYSPFTIRLGSWLGFIPFVWFTFQIGRLLPTKINRWAWYMTMLTTPFLIEFFSLARGYGMAMSWFLGVLYFSWRYIQTQNKRDLIWMGVLGLLTTLSSLSVLVAVVITYTVTFILAPLSLEKRNLKPLLLSWGLLITSQLPMVWYGFELKERNLLYYGGDSFVEFTLMSYSRYFLTGKPLWPIVAVVFALVFIYSLIHIFRTYRLTESSPKLLFGSVFILSVTAIFIQHILLGVNYPEDRAGLYLFPLLIGAWVVIPSLNAPKWLVAMIFLPMLWFPFDFARTSNITHSRLWPNEHVPFRFWDAAHQVQFNDFPGSMSAYGLRQAIWNFQSLGMDPSSSPSDADYPSKWADILLVDSVRIKKVDLIQYTQLDFDPISGQTLLKRDPALIEKEIFTDHIESLSIEGQYANLARIPVDSIGHGAKAIYLDFNLNSPTPLANLMVVASVFDKSGQEVWHSQYDLRLVNDHWNTRPQWKLKQFLPPFPKDTEYMVVYVYNPFMEKHTMSDIKFTLSDLYEPQEKIGVESR